MERGLKDCRSRIADLGVRILECGMRILECGFWISKLKSHNSKSSAGCLLPPASWLLGRRILVNSGFFSLEHA